MPGSSLVLEYQADPFMTPEEIARKLRVDQKTVSRWCVQGKLPAIKIPGNRWRIRRSDYLKLIQP